MKMTSSKQRGYTAVEVMLAIAILAVGAAGVMSMQKASIQGNADARKLDMANAIAREWVERLRRDATTWTLPNESFPTTHNWDTNTVFISQLAAVGSISKYAYPSANANAQWDGYSRAFDMLGRDIAPTGGSTQFPGAVFCTQVKLDWLSQDEMLRATVRVFWLQGLYTSPAGDFCNVDGATAGYPSGANANAVFHFLYVTTAIRRNPST
jgi:prepilin-type N-terminal cleavage/methylation domain-containing protein